MGTNGSIHAIRQQGLAKPGNDIIAWHPKNWSLKPWLEKTWRPGELELVNKFAGRNLGSEKVLW